MRKLLKKHGLLPETLVTDDLRSYRAAAHDIMRPSIGIVRPMAKHPRGEFASTDMATRTQDAEFQERGGSPKISLDPRHDLQHIQRPAPPHLSKNAPSLSGLNHADVARSRRRRVISAVEPDEPASNFQQHDNAVRHPSLLPPSSAVGPRPSQ